MESAQIKKFNHIKTRLVGILRTKPGTLAENAIQAIETAFSAGATAVEITSNSDFWEEVVAHCLKRGLNIGVGSIKNVKLAKQAINLGAKFLVSPGTFTEVIEFAAKHKVSMLPGVYHFSEVTHVKDLGVADQKFFPANVSTHEELFKAIREPFRDEFDDLIRRGWELSVFDSNKKYSIPCEMITSPTEFYNFYTKLSKKSFKCPVVFGLPPGKTGFDRLKEVVDLSIGIHTYAVGGVNDKNMKEVLTRYGAYGVCPGSGMFNADAILAGDFERVRADVKRHVMIANDTRSPI